MTRFTLYASERDKTCMEKIQACMKQFVSYVPLLLHLQLAQDLLLKKSPPLSRQPLLTPPLWEAIQPRPRCQQCLRLEKQQAQTGGPDRQ
jgi:hypothetical protein